MVLGGWKYAEVGVEIRGGVCRGIDEKQSNGVCYAEDYWHGFYLNFYEEIRWGMFGFLEIFS
jgi:hypothetical protein